MTMLYDTVSERNNIHRSNTVHYLLNSIVAGIGESFERSESLHNIVLHKLSSIHTDTFAVDCTSFLTDIELTEREGREHKAEYTVDTVDMVNSTVGRKLAVTVGTKSAATVGRKSVATGMETDIEPIQELEITA